MKALSGSSGDVGAGEVGSAPAVGVGRAEVGEVVHHGDVVFMASEGGEAFGHADLFKAPCFFGIEGVLGETETAAEKDHALGGSGGGGLGSGEGLQERQSHDRAPKSEKGATGG